MTRLTADFFQGNRERLAAKTGGLYVFSAYTKMQRTADEASFFEQEANFWYLTGIDAPDWQVIIDGTRGGKSWLVAPKVSASHELFDGSLSHEEAHKLSGIKDILSPDDADKLLRDLARHHSLVYALGDDPYAKYYDFSLNPAPKDVWRKLERIFREVQDARRDLAQLRAIKQPEEIAALKKAAKVTIDAFKSVKTKLPSLKHEYEVEAEFTYAFRKVGATGHAYDPIVAAGSHATTMHYSENSGPLKKNNLLLLDIGAKVDGYPADITRTYAVGTPTKRQKQLHTAVEAAQKEIIKLLAPGVSVQGYHEEVDRIMKEALQSLGLLSDPRDEQTYRRYFPHAISHGLGVDVHDSLGAPFEFKEGMVLTVEPGIYIPEEGIGVRIEDDILITATGHTNLTAALPTGL